MHVAVTCLGDSGPAASIPPPSLCSPSGLLSLLAFPLKVLGLLLFLPSAPPSWAEGLEEGAWGWWWGAEAAPLWVA